MKKYSSILFLLILFCFSCRPKLALPEDRLGSTSFNGFASNGEKIYASTSFGELYYSTNDGKKWKKLDTKGEFKWHRCLHIHNDQVFLGSSEGLFRTSDDGASWEQIEYKDLFDASIQCIVENKKYMFVCGISSGIHRSFDNGNTWTQLDSGLGNTWIYSITCENEKLVAYSDPAYFISTDNGNSWDTLSTSGITGKPNEICAIQGNKIYIEAESEGIFVSENNGAT